MSFSIYEIPKPASEEDVSKYTEIRLSTLSTNPEAFGSTYARESAFTPDQWVARVNTSGRKIFIAIDEDKWIGTLNVLYPEMLLGGPKSTPYPPEISAAEEKGDFDVLMIVGMWVCPGFRKRGVGEMLVQHTLETVQRNDINQPDAEIEPVAKPTARTRAILLRVHNENGAARSLYEKNGFSYRKDADSEETVSSDQSWMAYVME
jgi:GNAT superfamily N-acetyltransferase